MATLRIPTPPPQVFSYLYRIQLDGVFYRFQFRYNPRNGSYVLDVGNDNGTAVARNLRMVIGDDILAPHKALSVPQGNLRVVDTSGRGVDPTRLEFGDRVQLFYDEVDA